MNSDVIIIGAGASGLMCAIEAGRRGRSVLVLDHSDRIGSKIRISGGGRCNFTNTDLSPDNYISNNPHFCKSALSRFTPMDIISMLKRRGIEYLEKEAGQLFCRDSSNRIIEMLHDEICSAGGEIRLNCNIKKITRDSIFALKTNFGIFESKSLVVATGGLSYPNVGASDMGYKIASQFGIGITLLRPALVPFTLDPKDLKHAVELSGVSVKAGISTRGVTFTGDILFTHRGLSGPAVLQASSYWNPGEDLHIDLMPGVDAYELFILKRHGKIEMRNLLAQLLPRRLAHSWCDRYILSKPMNQYLDRELKDIADQIHDWKIRPAGTEGYKTAEVTLGGIDTNDLSSKTMESKKVPGLYFTGEVVDVTGQLGGYNLHWAWASGFAAGQYV